MKLTDLQTFVEIVDAGGLTAAAHRRGVTQPAISRTLRDLETRLQAQLLTRTGRGIHLTPAGEEFLTFAIETLARFGETQKRIIDHAKSPARDIRLSVPLRVGRLLIPGLYRGFGDKMPKTTVHIFEEASQRAREMLAEGRLDAALTYRTMARPDRDFVPLFTEPLFAVGHAATLRGEGPLPLASLSTLPLLLPSAGPYRDLIDAGFRAAGQPLRVHRALETAEGLLAFAAEGEGVAILPMSNVYQEIARGEVQARCITAPEITRTIGLQLNSAMSKPTAGPVISVVRRCMQQVAAEAMWRARPAQGRG